MTAIRWGHSSPEGGRVSANLHPLISASGHSSSAFSACTESYGVGTVATFYVTWLAWQAWLGLDCVF